MASSPSQSIHFSSTGARTLKRPYDEGSADEQEDVTVKCVKVTPTERSLERPRYIIAHEVTCDRHFDHAQRRLYQDIPQLYVGDNRTAALRGTINVTLDPLDQEFAEFNPDISFVVIRGYSCGAYHNEMKDEFKHLVIPEHLAKYLATFRSQLIVLTEDGKKAQPVSEKLYITSKALRIAIRAMQALHPTNFPLDEWSECLSEPSLDIYFVRSILTKYAFDSSSHMNGIDQSQLRAFLEYAESSYAPEYREADTQFAQGVVNERHFLKLFRSGDIVVHQTDIGPVAYELTKVRRGPFKILLECWNWAFDGQFYKKNETLTVDQLSETQPIPIETLPVHPLIYDRKHCQERLTERGKRFWECRRRRFVEYASSDSSFELRAANSRYMIDLPTYRQMHPEVTQDRDDYQVDLTMAEEPPGYPFLLLLPATIRGYGLHDKKWNTLTVDRIQEVQWSHDTFDRRLVLKSQKKELIKALITVHTAESKSHQADIIEGKGKGLILLLHGGPGTGKTLTAESIAEYAKKPLYRVTCGDIGTDPESVEKYLESVFYIGTLWGCVVLLDEADVFLEERTHTDLHRNALVSVFLRALEYFEGILVLTSNRVGTFDEAFKSRVQLAMHYPSLDEKGRWEIWNMFLRDLLNKEEKLRFEELKEKLDILARYSLNGRQIRNSVNTARQLARYKNEVLAYSHFEQALGVVNEFEEYITNMRGHTDEEYAKAQGHR